MTSFEPFFKTIQDWTNRIPIVILGSGASVPYNLPSMGVLGEFLKENIEFSDPDSSMQFEAFKSHLIQHNDLERALSEVFVNEQVQDEILNKTWWLINKHDLEAYKNIIESNYHISLIDLIKYFLVSAGRKATIITTNYDRIAEYAACIAGAYICTGFAQNFIGNFSSTIHRNNFSKIHGYSGQVNIWKVHGSLDWFKNTSEEHRQFPLIPEIPPNYIPSIVTPGTSKYYQTHKEPYRTIFAQSDEEIEVASGYLCIGYGFNDEHVQPKLINQIRANKPIVVITKKISEKTKQLIIDNNCSQYILMEEDDEPVNTKVYSSIHGDFIIPDVAYWKLDQYLSIII